MDDFTSDDEDTMSDFKSSMMRVFDMTDLGENEVLFGH